MNRKGYVFQLDSCRHRVSLRTASEASRSPATYVVWHSSTPIATDGRQYDNWRSTADRCAALLIRIRIDIANCAARFARFPGEHVGVQYNTAWTRYKGSERSERHDIFLYPYGGID